jgi:TatD DNase family protein
MFIDSHAHLGSPDFDQDRTAILERAKLAQVERILAIGSGTETAALDEAIKLAEEFSYLDASVGIHPHEAKLATSEDFDRLKKLATHPKVVAWGEIGLDFHYDHSPREVQRTVFIQQLVLAQEAHLPIIIHTREAEAETLQILKQYWSRSGLGGILHCFSGTLEMAEECIKMGFMVSFSGMLTFPKAQDIRDVAKKIPLERLLIETDSPFLAPVPYRGRRNEPAYVVETARSLAQLRTLSPEAVGEITGGNYRQFFKLT